MSDSSVRELSKRIGLPVNELLVQLHQAGVSASQPNDVITDAEELRLLEYIKSNKGSKKGKITLKRKTTSELRQQGGKTVSIEVRKKRTFVRRKPSVSATVETPSKKKSTSRTSASPASGTEALLKKLEAESRAREAAALGTTKKTKDKAQPLREAKASSGVTQTVAENTVEVLESKVETAINAVGVGLSQSENQMSTEQESVKNNRKNVAISPQSKEDKVTELTDTVAETPKVEIKTVNTATPQSAVAGETVKPVTQPAKTESPKQKPISAGVSARNERTKAEIEDKASHTLEPSAKVGSASEQAASRSDKKGVRSTKQAKSANKPDLTQANHVEDKPVERSTSAIDSKQEQQTIAGQVAVKTDKTKTSSQDEAEPKTQAEKTRDLFAKARAQREAVAKAARREAAALLKRRPSPTIKKAKVEKKKVVAKKAEEEKVTHAAKAKTKSTEAQKKNAAKPTSEAKAKDAKAKPVKGKKPSRRKVVGAGGDAASSDKRRNTTAVPDSGRKKRKKRRKDRRAAALHPQIERKHSFEKPTAPVVREIEIPETIVVSDLAIALAVKATEVIKVMMGMGVMATINQSIDQDTATLVVEELGHTAKSVTHDKEEVALSSITEDFSDYEKKSRPPVVTIMGHVDHGKTSLLDYIRSARVAAGEAGGITQHIGAYHVDTEHGTVSFLDTPGHAAFTAMRARGTQVTDIVILIVAADDGVMPTTLEAIKHTRAAKVPMIVAVNKIDKPDADPERVRSELSQHEVIPEDWGGEEVFVDISAKTGQGIDDLLESILLVAEVLELEARDDGPAKGMVVESGMEKGRGAVATVLVQEGQLARGDTVLCGREFGRIRAMFNEKGRTVKSAGPSIPVQITGLSGVPIAGDDVMVIADDRKAREIAELRSQEARDTKLATQQAAKLDRLFENMKEGEKSVVNLLIKADVQGSVEALRESLVKLSTDEVEVNVVSTGVGGINEGDVNLALASQAILIGFNVRAEAPARKLIGDTGVDLRYYSVIYDIMGDVKQAMSGLLSPELREEIIGTATVKDVFRSSSFGTVAGCLVIEGVVKKGNPIRVLRDNVVIYEGELESLRRHRDDVNDVRMGTECGIAVKNYNDVKVGDQIEVYERIEVERVIE